MTEDDEKIGENSGFYSDDDASSVYVEEHFTGVFTTRYCKGKSWIVGCETSYSAIKTPRSNLKQSEICKRENIETDIAKNNIKHHNVNASSTPSPKKVVVIKGGGSVSSVKDNLRNDTLNNMGKEESDNNNKVYENKNVESTPIKINKEEQKSTENGNVSQVHETEECNLGTENENPDKSSLENDKSENGKRINDSSTETSSLKMQASENCKDVLYNMAKTNGIDNTSSNKWLRSNKCLTVENWLKQNMRLTTHHKFKYYIQNIDLIEVNRMEMHNPGAFVCYDENQSCHFVNKEMQEQCSGMNVNVNIDNNSDFFMCASIFLFGNPDFHDKLRKITDIYSMRLEYIPKYENKDADCQSKLLGQSSHEDKQILAFSAMFMTKIEALVRVSDNKFFWKAYVPPAPNRSSRTMHLYYYSGNYCDLILRRHPCADR